MVSFAATQAIPEPHDFLVQGAGGFTCVECKWAELPHAADARWMRDVADLLVGARPKPLRVDQVIVARPSSSYPMPGGPRVLHGVDVGPELFPAVGA